MTIDDVCRKMTDNPLLCTIYEKKVIDKVRDLFQTAEDSEMLELLPHETVSKKTD